MNRVLLVLTNELKVWQGEKEATIRRKNSYPTKGLYEGALKYAQLQIDEFTLAIKLIKQIQEHHED